MDTDEQVRLLMSQALPDQEGNGSLRALATGQRTRRALDPINVRPLANRGFGAGRLFRILLTNSCAFSCDYCPMRAGRDLPRHALAPAALASIFLTAFRKGWVSGLFVTTGIPKSPRWAMDRLLELVEILRLRERYGGYLHAKAVSGAEPEQVERLALLCDRVSYNLESACQATLDRVAPEKRLDHGVELLRRVRDLSRRTGGRRLPGDPRPPGRAVSAGATTQFVVGMGAESDREFLGVAHALWRERAIHHPHFAAFRPIEDTPLEGAAETPAVRERRLYEADFLVRRYQFSPDELVFSEAGNLPLSRDPKLTWALAHPERFPVDLATAPREELLRVPGLGPVSVERILGARGSAARIELSDLAKAGAAARRARGFVSFRGRLLGRRNLQDELFPEEKFPGQSRTYTFSPGTFR
ncbi:MAG TPA: radical SAM protein [Thermoanaerobaculia bacterium]|nr:radical SAM protein [Thermoanaerobaculia bacterium]